MPNIDWWEYEYKEIPWFEWCYEINELWHIRSYWKRNNRGSELKPEPQRYIKPRIKYNGKNKHKFASVTLFNWLTHKHFYVARLVAQLFMWYDIKDKSKQICHIDWNGMNCAKSNLYIWTVSERATNSHNPWFLSSKINWNGWRNYRKARS